MNCVHLIILHAGNPWLLYGEGGYAGRAVILEEGKYKDTNVIKGLQLEVSPVLKCSLVTFFSIIKLNFLLG